MSAKLVDEVETVLERSEKRRGILIFIEIVVDILVYRQQRSGPAYRRGAALAHEGESKSIHAHLEFSSEVGVVTYEPVRYRGLRGDRGYCRMG